MARKPPSEGLETVYKTPGYSSSDTNPINQPVHLPDAQADFLDVAQLEEDPRDHFLTRKLVEAQPSERNRWRQLARAPDFQAVIEDEEPHLRAVERPVAVGDGVGYGLADLEVGVLGHIHAANPLLGHDLSSIAGLANGLFGRRCAAVFWRFV